MSIHGFRSRAGTPWSFAVGLLLCSCLPAPAALSANTPAPQFVTVAGDLQSELGCPSDWMPDCAATHLAYRSGGRRLAGDLQRPGRRLSVQGGPQQLLDRELRRPRPAQRRQPLAQPRLGRRGQVLLLAPDPLDHQQPERGDRHRPRQLPALPGLPGRLAAGLPALLAPGPGRRRHLHLLHPLDPGRQLRGEGRDQRELGRELRRRRRVRTAPTSPSPWPRTAPRPSSATTRRTHVLTVSAGSGGGAAQPASVTIPGSFQSEVGLLRRLAARAAPPPTWPTTPTDGVWQGTFNVPAGSYEYKAALNDSWDVNYGANAQLNGANLGLIARRARGGQVLLRSRDALGDQQPERRDRHGARQLPALPGLLRATGSRTACAPGSRTRTATASTPSPPAPSRPATTRPRSPSMRAGTRTTAPTALPNGANISFSVPQACVEIFFSYNSTTHVLTVSANGAPKGNIGRAQAYWVTADTIAWNPGAGVRRTGTSPSTTTPTAASPSSPPASPGGTTIPLTYDPAGLSAAVREKFPHIAGYLGLPRAGRPARRGARGPQGPDRRRRQGRRRQPGGRHRASRSRACSTTSTPTTARSAPPSPPATCRPCGSGRRPRARSSSTSSTTPTRPPPRPCLDDDPRSGDRRLERHRQRGLVRQVLPLRGGGLRPLHGARSRPTWSPTPTRSACRATASAARSSTSPTRRYKPAGWDTPGQAARSTRPRTSSSTSCTSATSAPTTPSVPADLRGTFKAFTLPLSNGMQPPALAGAGRPHARPPAAARSTSPPINEDKSQWQQPAGDLSSFPPDSEEQQARGAGGGGRRTASTGATTRGTTPCPRAATRPTRTARPASSSSARWCRRSTSSGLRVVMDVVYNHTSAAGQNDKLGARPHRARLLPPAQQRRQRRDQLLLPEHRLRAHHDGEAHGRLGGDLGQAVQGGRLPLRPDGPPHEARTC